MRKPILISSVALWIINKVKFIRTELGITQREVHKYLGLSDDGNILGAIESQFVINRYTDEQLNKLARKFTEIAVLKGSDNTYTLNDFYPPVDFDEKMVDKIVIKIQPTELKQTGVLYLLLVEEKDSFFNEWHSAKEIAHHCGSKAEKNWEAKDFTAIIEATVKKGNLLRKSDDEALFKRP